MTETFWRRCSSCKRQIGFASRYWSCSVTTCNRKGHSFVFCSVACWDAHLPTMRHREAWAEEQRSPAREAWDAQRDTLSSASSDTAPAIAKRVADAVTADGRNAPASSTPHRATEAPHDILIVASKLKQYIRARSGMNTSDSVLEALSNRVRALCEDAILRAREDGRKTVLDRDF